MELCDWGLRPRAGAGSEKLDILLNKLFIKSLSLFVRSHKYSPFQRPGCGKTGARGQGKAERVVSRNFKTQVQLNNGGCSQATPSPPSISQVGTGRALHGHLQGAMPRLPKP